MALTLAEMSNHIISYVCFEMLRGMSPISTTTSYLSHIECYLDIEGVESRFGIARTSRLVKLVCKGLINAFHKKNPKSGRVKLAFSLPMTEAVSVTLKNGPEWLRVLVGLAMRMGIWYLLRKGEYLKTSRNDGGLRRQHAEFMDKLGRRIPYNRVGKMKAQSLHVNVKFSKTDPHGYGRLIAHQRQREGAACIVTEMEEFVSATRDLWGIGEDKGVFAWPDGSDLTADEVAGEMKAIAVTLKCDEKKVSAHSLRYGGASLLASFGLPQYLIEYFGGWKEGSKTMPLYTRPEGSSLNIVSACFSRFEMGGEIGARLRRMGVV